jgi:hypothetical protein
MRCKRLVVRYGNNHTHTSVIDSFRINMRVGSGRTSTFSDVRRYLGQWESNLRKQDYFLLLDPQNEASILSFSLWLSLSLSLFVSLSLCLSVNLSLSLSFFLSFSLSLFLSLSLESMLLTLFRVFSETSIGDSKIPSLISDHALRNLHGRIFHDNSDWYLTFDSLCLAQ